MRKSISRNFMAFQILDLICPSCEAMAIYAHKFSFCESQGNDKSSLAWMEPLFFEKN